MKYTIVIEHCAERDIEQSYMWGCNEWGRSQASKWYKNLIKAIKTLGELPERQPIAPENDEFEEEIRQLIYGRYRVLFTIRGNKVFILHCRGAYKG